MVEIREIKVFSKKLNKDIILEAYTGDKDGVTVITATSLKNEFEKIKDPRAAQRARQRALGALHRRHPDGLRHCPGPDSGQ